MAHLQYLVFNNENIPMPASYSVNLSDVEADSGQKNLQPIRLMCKWA